MRLIDADALNETLEKRKGNFVQFSCTGESSYVDINACTAINIAEQCVDNAPTIDAVPVVRCKDCKYCTDCKYGDAYCMMNMIWYEENHYCSDGKRKEQSDETN